MRSLDGACLLLALLAASSCDTRQNFELPELTDSRMLVQPKDEPFGPSHFWPDGLAMREAPGGTVARDEVLGPDVLVTGLDDGRPALRVPIQVTRALLEEGERSFDVVCANCHGVDGDGVSVVATKMTERPPPSLHDPRVTRLAPGDVFRVTTLGYGLMMPMRTLLSIRERWAVVAYVEALVLSENIPLSRLSRDEQSRLEAIR